ncbi:MAG: molybdate ABC transporter permease subunit [Dehalococcoidia bacterium]|nr:molybdate ABC transporter permease subunit [Dehalococcoidia bacterium]
MSREPQRTATAATRRTPSLAPLFATPALLFVAFVIVPLGALAYRAAHDGVVPEQLRAEFVFDALRLSLITSTLTLVLALALGTPLAYLLARASFTGRQIVDTLVDLPMVLPPTVAGVALLVAFGRRGVFGPLLEPAGIELAFTTTAVVMAQLFVSAPFLVRSLKAGFEALDQTYEQVSATLGVSPLRTFWRITLRLSRPALVGGAVLCWARALSELGATLIFAGNFPGRTQTMPLAIITAFESSVGLSGAIALAVILLLVALALLLALRFALRRLPPFEL